MATHLHTAHVETLGDDDLLRVRMHALGLSAEASEAAIGAGDGATEGVDRVTSVVYRLFALQGQDWRSSKWAIGVRAPGLTSSDVVAALNERRIVRSWPMRGTVHLMPAEDIGWVQRLTNPRVLANAPKRREFLGMSDVVLDRVTEVSLSALAGGTSLTRDELSAAWTEAGIDWQPNWRYHLIWWLSQNGLTTFGPITDSSEAGGTSADPEPRLVLAAEWITNPRNLEGDDALVELATRYIRGRGAATQKDLAAWAMLPAADTQRGLTLAAETGAIARARRDGVSGAAGALWVDPEAVAAAASASHAASATRAATNGVWLLLPAFDEHLLGYTLRDPQLSPEHLPRIIPGKNGVFLATVVRDGRVVGTWRRDAKKASVSITAFPGEHIDLPALQPEVERWATFYGLDAATAELT